MCGNQFLCFIDQFASFLKEQKEVMLFSNQLHLHVWISEIDGQKQTSNSVNLSTKNKWDPDWRVIDLLHNLLNVS